MKALHPASVAAEPTGIPDNSAVPTAVLSYQSSYVIRPSNGAVGTWNFSASLLPHPVDFMYTSVTDSAGTVLGSFLNTQLTGANHVGKMASWLDIAQAWRLAAMSVTIYQDGPALADQGTLTACQALIKPTVTPAFGWVPNAQGAPSVHSYDPSDEPLYQVMQNMPNAYMGKSKEGLYAPLKLTDTCQHWKTQADLVSLSGVRAAGQAANFIPYYQTPADCGVFPHPTFGRFAWNAGAIVQNPITSPMLNEQVVHIAGNNLSVTTQFVVYIRAVLEVRCQPGTPYTPQLKLSPPHDRLALDTYFAIARDLKDAYPADFNDLGKIWNVIKGILGVAAPALKAIPVVGPALSAAAPALVAGGDALGTLIKAASSSKVMKSSSAADVARVQKVTQAMLTRAPKTQQKRKQRKPKPTKQVVILRSAKGSK